MTFQKVAILGVGLIGASFALALKKHGLADHIVGVGRRQSTLDAALEVGACDAATTDAVGAATDADLVFLASPVGQMPALCREIAPVVALDCLITDGGSTKAQVVAQCEPIFLDAGRGHFIGGHPLAGGEKSGAQWARADLFENAVWVITNTSQSHLPSHQNLHSIIDTIGARTLKMTPQFHDELLAISSHLPHLTASALVHVFSDCQKDAPQIANLVAGGWRDSTRIAAGNSEMWRDICLENAPTIITSVDSLITGLQQLKSYIEARDASQIENWLESAAAVRRQY